MTVRGPGAAHEGRQKGRGQTDEADEAREVADAPSFSAWFGSRGTSKAILIRVPPRVGPPWERAS